MRQEIVVDSFAGGGGASTGIEMAIGRSVNETVFDNGPVERLKGGYMNIRREAIQVAAVAVALVENLDRLSVGGRIR